MYFFSGAKAGFLAVVGEAPFVAAGVAVEAVVVAALVPAAGAAAGIFEDRATRDTELFPALLFFFKAPPIMI